MEDIVIPETWTETLKRALSGNRKVVALSGKTNRSLRNAKDLQIVLETDRVWSGEMVAGPDLASCRDVTRGIQSPGTEIITLPARTEMGAPEKVARTLKRLAECEDLAAFQASGIEFGELVRTVLDWHGEKKATKNVIKALADAFQAEVEVDGHPVNRYAQAVEMLSFASAIAPLLEPDQLVRIIRLAPATMAAYQPIKDPLSISAHLESTLGRYRAERRERILADLWKIAHQRRWWDLKRKRKLQDPYYGQQRRHGHLDRTAYEQQRLQQIAEHEAQKDAAAAALWKDGTLALSEEALNLSWWDCTRWGEEDAKLLGRLVRNVGKDAYDAVVEAVRHLPSFEDVIANPMLAAKEHEAGRSLKHLKHSGWAQEEWLAARYPVLVQLLKALGDESQKAGLKRMENSQHVDQVMAYTWMWEHLTDEQFEEYVLSLGKKKGEAYRENSGFEILQRHLHSGKVELSPERLGALYKAFGTTANRRVHLAVAGLCTREQYAALVRTGALSARAKLLESPHTTTEDVTRVIEAIIADEEFGTEQVKVIAQHAQKLGRGDLDRIYTDLSVPNRIEFLTHLGTEELAELLENEVEDDETILAAVLPQRENRIRITRDEEHLEEEFRSMAEIISRIRSWKTSEAALKTLSARPLIAARLDTEALVRLVRKADDRQHIRNFLAGVAELEIQLDADVWVAALQKGAAPEGSSEADQVIASGRISEKDIAKLAASQDPDALVSAAHSPRTVPAKRPASPTVELAERIVKDTDDVAENEWPERPQQWADLIPQAGTKPYQLAPEVQKLHGMELPGVEGVKMQLLRTPLELHRNAEHMGNCTYGYHRDVNTGHAVLGYFRTPEGLECNFAFAKDPYHHMRQGCKPEQQWYLREVNTRFNRGGAPLEVRTALEKLAASL